MLRKIDNHLSLKGHSGVVLAIYYLAQDKGGTGSSGILQAIAKRSLD